MVAGGLETVLAGRVGDGAPLTVGVQIAVRAPPVALGVRLLFELDAVALFVSGTELAVVGQVPGVRYDGCIAVLAGHQRRRRRQRYEDEYLRRAEWKQNKKKTDFEYCCRVGARPTVLVNVLLRRFSNPYEL